MNEIFKDMEEIVTAFDSYLDRMFDRGAFDPECKEDSDLDILVNKMKKKYCKNKPYSPFHWAPTDKRTAFPEKFS